MKVDHAENGPKKFLLACRKSASILHLQVFQSKVVFDPRPPPDTRPPRPGPHFASRVGALDPAFPQETIRIISN